jgi:hypothetical protein
VELPGGKIKGPTEAARQCRTGLLRMRGTTFADNGKGAEIPAPFP